jgi:hypothetical protein
MVYMAQLSDAAGRSERIPQAYELVGAEQTVVCGLDADSRNAPIGFAASLARRLGWRLSLVPLPEAAARDDRLGRLFTAATQDRAGFVVTEAARSDAGAAALVELSRGAPCPLIAVPGGVRALGTGPILSGIAGRGPSGAAARAASRLANTIGARLRPVDVVSHKRLSELARREDAALVAVGTPGGNAASPDRVVAAVLRDSQVPVMLVPGGTAAPPASEAA